VKGLKERLKLIWNFWRGGVVQTRIPVEGVWIFSGATQCQVPIILLEMPKYWDVKIFFTLQICLTR